MNEILKLEKQRDEIEAKLAAVRAEEARLKVNPLHGIATILHKNLCKHNHDDGCGWYYGHISEPRAEHRHYLDKARKLQAFLQDQGIQDPVGFVEEFYDSIMT
jgi:hypothetical protein